MLLLTDAAIRDLAYRQADCQDPAFDWGALALRPRECTKLSKVLTVLLTDPDRTLRRGALGIFADAAVPLSFTRPSILVALLGAVAVATTPDSADESDPRLLIASEKAWNALRFALRNKTRRFRRDWLSNPSWKRHNQRESAA